MKTKLVHKSEIKIGDTVIHYGGYKNRTIAGEISIKPGTMVKWRVKI